MLFQRNSVIKVFSKCLIFKNILTSHLFLFFYNSIQTFSAVGSLYGLNRINIENNKKNQSHVTLKCKEFLFSFICSSLPSTLVSVFTPIAKKQLLSHCIYVNFCCNDLLSCMNLCFTLMQGYNLKRSPKNLHID